MAAVVFALCAVTSIVCAVLLWRGWRAAGGRLLLWTAIGFICFAANNVLLFVDEVVVPDNDLQLTRDLTSFAAVTIILFGLIWDQRELRR
jgi:uncharacterized membrane protein YhhN